MDLTVGWKDSSDTAMLEHFSIRLSGRHVAFLTNRRCAIIFRRKA